MGLGLAFRLFFRGLAADAKFADQARQLLAGGLPAAPAAAPPPATAPAPAPAKSGRSQALDLLALLQREGRLVDFLKENLAAYSDAQIGSAVRDVHRDCAAALERAFGLVPVRSEAEGAPVTVPAGFDASSVRLTGNVAGQAPYQGTLRHAGWQATRCDLPAYTGSDAAAKVIAPAEVEV
ncbi:MAG: DUF2760 domain-containing protein [Tepidisphaerales bacterium]